MAGSLPGIPPGRRPPRLAVSAGRITALTAVSDEGDAAALIGPGTHVVDALGHRMIPGLNDLHIHLIRGGVSYLLKLR
jgi:predicted amidohydrolase YtcJ